MMLKHTLVKIALLVFLGLSPAVAQDPAASPPDPELIQLEDRARQGDDKAQMKLAAFYDRGLGVRRNRVKAFTWYSIAEKHGQKSSRKQRLFKSLHADGIAEAQILIRRYMKTINSADDDR